MPGDSSTCSVPIRADSIGNTVGLKAACMGPIAGGALTGLFRAMPTAGMEGPAGMGGEYLGAFTTGCEPPQLLHPEGAGATIAGAPCQPGGGAAGTGSLRV